MHPGSKRELRATFAAPSTTGLSRCTRPTHQFRTALAEEIIASTDLVPEMHGSHGRDSSGFVEESNEQWVGRIMHPGNNRERQDWNRPHR